MPLQQTPLDQLPTNITIVDRNGFPTQAFVFYLLKMFKKAQVDNINFSALQKEIDDVETGAGLATDGTYVPDALTQYISAAISLFNADVILDNKLYDTIRRVEAISASGPVPVGNYLIKADANAAPITLTLPAAVSAIDKTVAITKVDTTANIVTIVGSGAELVAGEASQVLLRDGECLELTSDGLNWYVGG